MYKCRKYKITLKKALQSNTKNRQLADLYDYIVNMFDHVRGCGGGPCEGRGQGFDRVQSLYGEGRGIPVWWVVVTWDPTLCEQTDTYN